ncbi:PAS domain-containing protein [Polyangium jinanense]|uniref:PAS domain-containing protein n=1 Tax=Polyangium jinanense TaxID=2829994 RepID=A0A9X3X941_9BACT|nr:PAS domain-containing protein [Polyangium jinanense]MDC3958160.1 PAS domain-containing protein [Polyangium jinanense]MDC3983641.1 PAS domain-containing protein [Polyangium jinanense]
MNVQEFQGLQAESDRLRARVAELEEALAAANHRADLYQAVFECIPVPAVVHDVEGLVFDINRKNREFCAIPDRELVIGKHNLLKDPDAVARGYAAHLERATRGEASVMPPTSFNTAEVGFDNAEDRELWSETSYAPVDVAGKRYVVSVNLDVTERIRAQRALEASQQFLLGIIENAPSLVYVKDLAGRYMLVNSQVEQFVQMNREGLLGKTDAELFPSEIAESYSASDALVLRTGEPLTREDVMPLEGGIVAYVTTKFPLRDAEGKPVAVCSISVDVTTQKEAEARARKLQEEMLGLQEATLRALSTPLLPIAEGVVVMPLIGHIDARRAEQVLETLLHGIVQNQASIVILDVTGVPVVDEQVASTLVQAARAVELLGAEVVLTGIQPAMARTLVEIGAELGRMRTRSTLRGGIALALGRGATRGKR